MGNGGWGMEDGGLGDETMKKIGEEIVRYDREGNKRSGIHEGGGGYTCCKCLHGGRSTSQTPQSDFFYQTPYLCYGIYGRWNKACDTDRSTLEENMFLEVVLVAAGDDDLVDLIGVRKGLLSLCVWVDWNGQ